MWTCRNPRKRRGPRRARPTRNRRPPRRHRKRRASGQSLRESSPATVLRFLAKIGPFAAHGCANRQQSRARWLTVPAAISSSHRGFVPMSKSPHAHPSLRHNGTLATLLCGTLLLAAGAAFSQEKADLDAAARIRDAALNHSQIMDLVGYITDVTGPRLTGSPNLKRAEEYARDKLRDWGLANAHLGAWGPFGRGWSMEGFTANMLAPGFSPLIAYPKAWSPGTNGTIRGEAVFLDVKTAADLDKYKGKLKRKIVLFSPARHVDPLFEPPAHRQTDEELLSLANAEPPGEPRPFQFTPEQRATADLNYRKWRLIQSEGAAVVLQPGFRDGGTVYVTSATVPYPPAVPYEERAHAWDLSRPVVTPQAVVAAEQYNRIVRLAARKSV